VAEFYPWIKAAHIIAVISWMAGLLYLPRLFIYHCQAQTGSDKSQTFKIMERRLFRAIMNPAMILVWITGPMMVYFGEFWAEPWFLVKGVFIVVLTIAHHAFGRWRKGFEVDANTRSEKFYRIANEVPAVAMVAIVILVVVKPF
jgi:putative membrane protein